MRRENRERYYEEEEPQAVWREPARYRDEDDFGSPHDQGEHASSQYPRPREYERRDYEGQGPRRQYGDSGSYRQPYREGWGSDSDYSGYRPEPRFERQYRESYRPPYREARTYGREEYWRQEPGAYRGQERGAWEEDQRRSEQRGYPEQQYRSREEDRGYGGERGAPRNYNRREPMRQEERRGLEEHYGGQEGREYRREREFRGEGSRPGYEGRDDYEQRRGRSFEGQGRRQDQAGQYEEWLEEHQGRDRGTEGDRQLEGLREEHRHHHSDQRYEEDTRGRQPRSRRRFEQGDEQEGSPVNRATQVRTRSSSQSKPRTTARSGRSK
jgi:hypothetical protein